jgi:hypothetical protein
MNFGSELDILKNYIETSGITKGIKSYYSYINYLKKNVNKTMHVYSSMPTDQRVMYDEPGLHDYLKHNLHAKLTIKDTSYRFITKQADPTIGVEFDATVTQIITILILHRSVLHSKLDYLDNLYLNDKFDNCQIKDAYPMSLSKLKNKSYADFLYLSMTTAPQNVDLDNFDYFVFWNQRQIKTKSGWVGKGSMVMRIDSTNLNFIMKNKQVESVHISSNDEQKIFSQQASEFLVIFFKTLSLDFVFNNYDFSDKIRLGYNQENRLGFHKSKDCKMIVGFELFLDFVELEMSGGVYRFINSKHTYTVKGKTIPLETFDTCILRREGLSNFIDIIDLNNNEEEDINQLCGVMLTDHQEFGREYSYDLEDLFKNFRGSELYRFMIHHLEKRNKDKVKPVEFIWEDIMNNMKTDVELKDSLHNIFKGTEIADLTDDISLGKINRFLLYEIDDINLLRFRESLVGKSKDDIFLLIKEQISRIGTETTSLVMMEEVGNYSSFSKFEKNNVGNYNISILENVVRDLNYTLSAILDDFSELKKQDILYPFVDVKKYSNTTLDQIFENVYLADYSATSVVINAPGVSMYLMIVKRILSIIFNDHQIFSDWSNFAANTSLKIFPRLPQYDTEWQVLISNLIESLTMKLVQSSVTKTNELKKLRSLRRIKKNNILFARNKKSTLEFKIRKPVPIDLEDLYYPITYSTRYTYGKDLDLTFHEIVESGLFENKYTSDEEGLIAESITIEYQSKMRPYNDFFNNNSGVFSNKGDYMLAFGPIETALAMQTNMKRKKFTIIISDSFIETCKGPLVIDGSIMNLNHNMFMYIPNNVDISSIFGQAITNLPSDIKKSFEETLYEISNTEFDYTKMFSAEHTRKELIPELIDEIKFNPVLDNFNMFSDSCYTDELVSFIKIKFKLEEADTIKCEDIVLSDNTPILKIQKLRKLLNEISKTGDSFGEIISEILDSTLEEVMDFDMKKSKIDRIEKYLMNTNYTMNGLLRTCSDPIAVKQLDDLTGGLLMSVLKKEVHISKTAKKHLISTYKMLYSENKGSTRRDIRTAIRFMLDLLEELDGKDCSNKKGSQLIEVYMKYHTEIVEESDISEDYEQPTFKRSINTSFKRKT